MGAETREACFDGLVGPTHSYAGMAVGNVASMAHGGQASDPRQAALEGLAKMRRARALGVHQALLPPHERPHLPLLRRLGFGGSEADALAAAARDAPGLLAAACSASAMWTANAATVSASADTADGRVHLTPANLVHHLHRAIEAPQTARALRRIFADEARFVVHAPLPASPALGDEGAANHTRLAAPGGRAAQLFVYGRAEGEPGPRRFAARQARAASEAIARQHGLDPSRVCFARQAPEAIDAGVFHNDVIALGHGGLLLYHARAFADPSVPEALDAMLGGALVPLCVPEAAVPLEDAVASYLFNAQLLDAPGGAYMLAPAEAEALPRVRAYLEALLADPAAPLVGLEYLSLRQSMRNGGGPACLRLRVPLTAAERAAVHPGVWLDDAKEAALEAWVRAHYRDCLRPEDLRDPALLDESRRALDALCGLLGLGGAFYDFQSAGA